MSKSFFYQNHSLVLHLLRYLTSRNHWTWTCKISDYLSGLRLTLWYIGLGLKNTWIAYWTRMLKWDLQSTQTKLLDLDWFYDILDLDLINTWTNLLDSDWFYYKQAGMLLEKYENLLQGYTVKLFFQCIS